MKKYACLISVIFLFAALLKAQEAKEKGFQSIRQNVVKAQLEFLSSDWMEGRGTGEKGEFMAGDYIASMFRLFGILPGGDSARTQVSREEHFMNGTEPETYSSYFQNYELIKSTPTSDHVLGVKDCTEDGAKVIYFEQHVDFNIQNQPTTGISIESPLVFVGYGFSDEEQGYDDYKNTDVQGKVILRLKGYPGMHDTASKGYKLFHPKNIRDTYRMIRQKDRLAAEKGVAAIIEIDRDFELPESWTANHPFRFNYTYYEGDTDLPDIYDFSMHLPGDSLSNRPLSIELSTRAINYLLDGQDLDLSAFEKQVAEKLKSNPTELENTKIILDYKPDLELIKSRNVIGYIEGKRKDEIIIVGGHYDHLGKYNGYIWNGADDNASGTVAVMTLARAFAMAGSQPERTIVFAAWSGEEKGLLGSTYFARHPFGDSLDNIKIYLNFDMVSRDAKDDSLGNQGAMSFKDSLPFLEEMGKEHIADRDLNLDFKYWPSKGQSGGSDYYPFSVKGIPFICYWGGFHMDYHRPGDHTSKINYKKLTGIIRLAYLNIWELVNEEWPEN
ncbi:MAG: M20/M25/M40 family metallo-hydrolase [Bacteroidales bacterium]|nr:M20/M25/M40 family metallo-hydrolase [Bacteroidales bacterium]MCF8352292.1 M20/M25/M40 family metallo-hydrolase [Bacteroidales bacterium]MCF8377190.1 M20/M25/M40 family metallo-hydrolase [Bacteroidales bacterium]MCF8401061.1 M20/M25/M40 family metallo-hydrolase [Bacteroidales bacterium]